MFYRLFAPPCREENCYKDNIKQVRSHAEARMHELHLLFLMSRLLCLCCVVTVKSFPVLAFNVVDIITIVRLYT